MKNMDKKSIILLVILYSYLIFYTVSFPFITYLDKIINPLFWIALSIFTFLFNKDSFQRIPGKTNKLQAIFIIILSYLLIYFPLGLIIGYGKSLYSHDILSTLINIWSIGLIVVFQEYIRNVILVNSKRSKFIFIMTFIVYTLFYINIFALINSNLDLVLWFEKFSSIILPSISVNLLLNYLSLKSGYFSCLIYKLPLVLAEILLPILPKLDWFMTAILGTLLPFITFIIVKNLDDKKMERKKDKRTKSIVGYIPLIFILVIFVCFVAGFFRYKPVAIVSNSMQPIFSRGDIVVVTKVNDKNIKNIKLYDIIEYSLDSIVVVHRIISMEENNDGTRTYITQGDNNNSADKEKVKESQIIGVVRFSVPKVGYPSVFLSEFFNKNTNVNVETGK